MPLPAIGEVNRFGETWNGQRWTPASQGSDARGFPMLQVPPPTPSGRTDAQDLELLKQFLTTGGTLAGGALAGPPGAVLGGAAGRMLGHVPEAMATAATGTPNDSSFGGDAAIGGGEGAVQEALGLAGPPLKWVGGKVASLGRAVGGDGIASLVKRALLGGGLGELFGGHTGGLTGATVAELAPKAVEVGGNLMERAGTAMGAAEPFSAKSSRWLDSLLNRESPLSHADEMAAGAERYGARKTAAASQESALDRVRQAPPSYTDRARIPNSPRGPINPADDIFGNYQPLGASARPPLKVEPSSALDALLSDEPAVSSLDRAVPRDRQFVLQPDEWRAEDLLNANRLRRAKLGGMQSAEKAYKP